MLPQQLVEETEELRREGHRIDLVEADGWANIVFHDYAVPAGYTKQSTDLLLKFPLSYPNGRPDMFWTDEDLLLLSGGRAPQNADTIETALERKWRRFSWHPANWNLSRDSLRTYLEFVNARLGRAV